MNNASNSQYNILLIEPELTLAHSIEHWLKERGHVVHIQNINQAQNQIFTNRWDVVIADIQAPKINDLNISKLTKEVDSTTAILIIAENIKIDFILTAMEYHTDALLFKPLNQKEFIDKVESLAAESRKNREKKNNRVVLAIGAHPDDVEYGCAGTLAKYQAVGDNIHILTLSSGSVGGNPLIRKKEAENAAAVQKAKLVMGDFEDTQISNSAQTIQFIEKIVQQINPTHIYTHSANDSHQDHRAVYHSTITACRHVANVFCYLSPSSTVDFKPNTFINIDHYIGTKLQVIGEFKSQIELRPYLHPEIITATARYWGRYCNYHLAEPMEVIREYS